MLLTYMQTSRPIKHFFHSIAAVPRHQVTITDQYSSVRNQDFRMFECGINFTNIFDIYYGHPAQQMQTLYFHPVVSSIFFYLFFPRLISAVAHGCLPHFHTWCGLSANLRYRSETCCTRLAENTGRKKSRQKSPSGHHRTTLLGYSFATKACIDNPRWRFLATFLRPVFAASRVQQVSDLHSKFGLRPRHVQKYGRHPISDR